MISSSKGQLQMRVEKMRQIQPEVHLEQNAHRECFAPRVLRTKLRHKFYAIFDLVGAFYKFVIFLTSAN